jgi:hypothetical protein
MSDFSLAPRVTLSFGRMGSGKTTFCYRYLINALTPQPANPEPAACVFIFDWKLEASRRLGVPAVTTPHGCEAALDQRLVIFNPHVAFPGDNYVRNPEGERVLNDDKMAFRWFCKWALEASQRGPGRKIIYLDELKQFASKFYIPPELNKIARLGRAENLELLTSTQYPRDYHSDIRGAVTEWVCFSCTEPAELDAVRPYFPNVDKAAGLPLGSFIGFNRNSQAELPGKVF